MAGLTSKERECLALAAMGESDKRIASQLGLTPRAVSTHLSRAYRKLGVTNRTQAAALMRNSTHAQSSAIADVSHPGSAGSAPNGDADGDNSSPPSTLDLGTGEHSVASHSSFTRSGRLPASTTGGDPRGKRGDAARRDSSGDPVARSRDPKPVERGWYRPPPRALAAKLTIILLLMGVSALAAPTIIGLINTAQHSFQANDLSR